MVEVESSNIKAIGFENDKLNVQYKSGKTYAYENTTKELYESLLKSESKGRFMNENVKGKYSYSIVG